VPLTLSLTQPFAPPLAVATAVSVSKGRRFVADEVTRAIGELSGQEYVHLYSSDVKTRLAAGDGGA